VSIRILHGDCREVLRGLPDNSVDSIVTDPPYGLTANKKGGSGVASVNMESPYGRARIGTGNGPGGFMGMKWDSDVPPVEVWAECLRVLKPGGYLLAFAGTRTQHRMCCRIEDAGFEIRDLIAWVYGSGFPKSLDVSKAIDKAIDKAMGVEGGRGEVKSDRHASMIRTGRVGAGKQEGWARDAHTDPDRIDATAREYIPGSEQAQHFKGWGTALKPALEPITVARKPLIGTVAENVLQHGTGALNIDGCRVEPTGESRERTNEASQDRRYADLGGTNFAATPGIRGGDPLGRWPANLIHDGSDEVVALFPRDAGAAAPVRGTEASAASVGRVTGERERIPGAFHADTGSAARFFYCAKADRADRNEGLSDPGPQFTMGRLPHHGEKVNAARKGNHHPTVKPTDLMRYLCRLVTPPGGVVLDPFMGSGSTLKAAELEGFSAIGIELSADYIEIARRRIAADAPLFAEVQA